MEDSRRALVCDNLTKVYGSSETKALDALSFSVPSRGIFVLIGRNGSGKTTLVRILATELEPTSGSASINGIDVVKEAWKLRERIAIVPQEARPVPWMTPMQTVQSYLLWRGFEYAEANRKASQALERLGLSRQSHDLNRKLSGGMRRKVMVATVLSSEADVIFLDEPTTGLDPISRREFWATLREIGHERFTFLTTHYLEEAEELGDRIGILDRGRLNRIGTLNDLRDSVPYNYSLKILSNPPTGIPTPQKGETVTGTEGSSMILTTEEEAYRISRELARTNVKFAVGPVSLDDIFFYLARREARE
ncbi:MAG TPA: ABC transporter ATP-binding protein [Candidatus Acidoferrales bacterium]|nr:ABC transporter ATP-binding protein [Candidatus Acidoferrales bacterium]